MTRTVRSILSKKNASAALKRMFKEKDKEEQTGKKPRKPHRFRSGTVAIRTIKKLQKSTLPILAMAPFQRLIRQIAEEHKAGVRFNKLALDAIRCATEVHMYNVFVRAQELSIHAKRKKVMDRDTYLALKYEGVPEYSGN